MEENKGHTSRDKFNSNSKKNKVMSYPSRPLAWNRGDYQRGDFRGDYFNYHTNGNGNNGVSDGFSSFHNLNEINYSREQIAEYLREKSNFEEYKSKKKHLVQKMKKIEHDLDCACDCSKNKLEELNAREKDLNLREKKLLERKEKLEAYDKQLKTENKLSLLEIRHKEQLAKANIENKLADALPSDLFAYLKAREEIWNKQISILKKELEQYQVKQIANNWAIPSIPYNLRTNPCFIIGGYASANENLMDLRDRRDQLKTLKEVDAVNQETLTHLRAIIDHNNAENRRVFEEIAEHKVVSTFIVTDADKKFPNKLDKTIAIGVGNTSQEATTAAAYWALHSIFKEEKLKENQTPNESIFTKNF